MKKIFVIFLFLAGCADSDFLDKTRIDGSIIRGQVVHENDATYKHVALIVHNFKYAGAKHSFSSICTAVVLDQTHLLTAAHCAENFENSRVLLVQNALNTSVDEKLIYKIENTIIHESYDLQSEDKENENYDIAILKVDRLLDTKEFNPGYLELPTTQIFLKKSDPKKLNPTILGYGRSSTLATLPNDMTENAVSGILRKTQIKIDDFKYSKKQIIIDQRNKPGLCMGDSGGPLFIHRDGQLYLQGLSVAVLKHGKNKDTVNNACDDTGIILNLDFLKDWIQNQLTNSI